MDEPATSPNPTPADVRASVASDDGLVTATVDGTGRLVELVLEPTAMRKQSADLAALVVTTVGNAQDGARQQAAARLAEFAAPLPDTAELTDTLQALHTTATTRLAEMSATLSQLLDRTNGGPR